MIRAPLRKPVDGLKLAVVHSCFECGCTLRSLHYRVFINGTLRRFCLRDYQVHMAQREDVS